MRWNAEPVSDLILISGFQEQEVLSTKANKIFFQPSLINFKEI
jgi:hypothetical protein